MKIILFTFAFLVLLCGCGERSAQVDKPADRVMSAPAWMKVRITCDKNTFRLGEPVTIMIMMQKLIDEEIEAPIAYYSAIVKIDGKEFKKTWGPNGGPKSLIDTSWPRPPWSGPALISKGSEIGIELSLSEYGISKEALPVGIHELVVSIGKDVSNTLTITVTEDR